MGENNFYRPFRNTRLEVENNFKFVAPNQTNKYTRRSEEFLKIEFLKPSHFKAAALKVAIAVSLILAVILLIESVTKS